jgi:hypothetical protein
MEDLQAKLDELKIKQYMNESYFKKASEQYNDLHSEIAEEIANLEKQIADSEVTYSIGDCFENKSTKTKYILAFLGDDGIDMISLESGCRWMTPIQPLRRGKVTTAEMKPLLISFNRTWDFHKQCKC